MTTRHSSSTDFAPVPTGFDPIVRNPPSGNQPVEEKTIGFPRSNRISVDLNPSSQNSRKRKRRPDSKRKAIAKRPKGRWFVSLFILSIVLIAGNKIWTEFIQFQAYGTLEGRIIELRIPWNGVIQSLHVREGDAIEQGQLLATINNLEFKNERLKLKQELQIAMAGLTSRIAEINSNHQVREDSILRMQIEYYQLLGRYHQESAKLIELTKAESTNSKLFEKRSVSRSRLELSRIELASQRALVTEQAAALETLKARLDADPRESGETVESLAIEHARIQSIQAEFDRLAMFEEMGEIRAPVSGRIVRRHHFTGEFLQKSELLFEILEDGSLQAVVYVPQSQANGFSQGNEVQLVLPPYQSEKTFVIDRIGDQMIPAPASIQRFYNAHQKLVPVFTFPKPGELIDTQGENSIWLGAEVRLPRFRPVAEGTQDGTWFSDYCHKLTQWTR